MEIAQILAVFELNERGKVCNEWFGRTGHIFYFLCGSSEERRQLIKHLKEKEIQAVFHYISLHSSPFFKKKYKGKKLENSDFFSDHLVRLPLYYELANTEQEKIINEIKSFYA